MPAVNLQRDSVLPAEDFWARHLRAFRISGGLLLLLLVILFLDHRGPGHGVVFVEPQQPDALC